MSCAPAGYQSLDPLPAPVPALGDLSIRIAYPRPADTSYARGDTLVLIAREDQVYPRVDSVFMFGTVGRGDATVTVNGVDVDVYPTGAWIAWLPLVADSMARFVIRAESDGEIRHAVFRVPIRAVFEPPGEGVWIDTTSLDPLGDFWVTEDEGYLLSVRAKPGASLELVLPGDSTEPLMRRSLPSLGSWGDLAFGTESGASERTIDRYVIWRRGLFGPDPGDLFAPSDTPAGDSGWVLLRAVADGDTMTVRWPLRVAVLPSFPPAVGVVNDDPQFTGQTDGVSPGRPSPWGTYHWFFPNGTVSRVSGRRGAQTRLQLSATSVAWVNSADVQGLPPGTPPPSGTTNSIRLFPGAGSVVLRVPLAHRIPFLVEEDANVLRLRLYGVAADMDWLQYGGTDRLVRRLSFEQPTSDEIVVRVELAEDVWGYRTRWEGNALLLEIRRPPELQRGNPLRGVTVALDAGHPPAGALGPSLVGEWDVTLAVARRAAELLERRGATVLLIRDSEEAMGLAARTDLAEAADADVLVSIHANALPDGVNPFENNGTSVYYNRPRSEPLARTLNRALVGQFGYPDLGIGRADLALTRPTWMPAVLTEGLFLMLPEQEAVLVSAAGQERYARGIVIGLENFLRDRASATR